MKYRCEHAACGGTFDILHKGHTSLLARAFKIGQKVSIGVTTDAFCKKLGKIPFESQLVRRKNISAFLKLNRLQNRAKIIWLTDIYGSTARDKSLQAIVVSKETLEGAAKINQVRTRSNLKKLRIVVCPEVLAGDGKKISTGRIKNGEISPDGVSYNLLLKKIAGKRFSDKIRAKLKKPFGKITRVERNTKFARPIIAVGDITVQNLLKNKITPDISIIDFFVNRRREFANLGQLGFTQPNPDHIVENVPGQISKNLTETVRKTINNRAGRQTILVKGEEDLAFIPALLQSPVPATVVYGQPGIGIVMSKVTPQTKDKLCSLLSLT